MRLLKSLHNLFFPHSGNNHKARILHPACLSVLVGLFLVGQFGLNFFSLVSPAILGFASEITPEQVVELTNQRRAESGLSALSINAVLNEVAQRKAGDMFAFDYWAHTSPSGRDPWSFFQETGYDYLYAGENLARDFMNSDSVVTAWMNSATHKGNILNSHYQEIGLAVVNGTLDGVETTLVVQVFGTPTPAPEQNRTFFSPSSLVGKASAAAAMAEPAKPIKPLVSPFSFTKVVALFLLGVIFGALIVDAFLMAKRKIVRLSGKNLAHLLFLAVILLAILATMPGAIL